MEYGKFGKEMVEAAQKEAACTARKLAGTFGFSHEDREDLEQELILAVLEKADVFDPERASIRTFVGAVIRGKVLMELRRRRRQNKWGHMIPCLHDEIVNEEESLPYHETLDRAVCLERMGRYQPDLCLLADFCHDLAVVLKRLASRQQDISRVLAKTNKTAAAHRLGISRQTLYRELKAMRKSLAPTEIDTYLAKM